MQSLVHRVLLGWHLVHCKVSHTNWQSLEKQVSCCVSLWTFVTYSQRCQLSFEQTNTSIQFHQLVVLLFLFSYLINIWIIRPFIKVISQHGHALFSLHCTQVEFQWADHFSLIIIWLPNEMTIDDNEVHMCTFLFFFLRDYKSRQADGEWLDKTKKFVYFFDIWHQTSTENEFIIKKKKVNSLLWWNDN